MFKELILSLLLTMPAFAKTNVNTWVCRPSAGAHWSILNFELDMTTERLTSGSQITARIKSLKESSANPLISAAFENYQLKTSPIDESSDRLDFVMQGLVNPQVVAGTTSIDGLSVSGYIVIDENMNGAEPVYASFSFNHTTFANVSIFCNIK